MPVSRSGTARNRHIIFRALVALEPLLSLMCRFGACNARISGDTHTHTQTHTETHRTTTVTLAAHARRGLPDVPSRVGGAVGYDTTRASSVTFTIASKPRRVVMTFVPRIM